jgi:hypothetical protein
MSSYFTDPHFVDNLLRFLVYDRDFLKQASHLLTPEDFIKRKKGEGEERQVVAELALNFWTRYREPVGRMLKVECKEYTRKKGWDQPTVDRIVEYADVLSDKTKRVAGDAMLEKVRQYKVDHQISIAIEQMQNAVGHGTLTTDSFLEIARKAVEGVGKESGRPVDVFSEKQLESRIARRELQRQRQRFPVLLIDPIDRLVRIIARKHLGLVLAPYKRGKTLFFIWLALAYTLQGLDVMYVTLEDPLEDIEDRFDAAITALPVSRLVDVPEKVRLKFKRYKGLLRSKLKIIDGTDGAMTIGALENIWEMEKNRGFCADAVLIDYDDEIRPQKRQQERRMEFADIYRDFRAFLARHDLLGWTASQTSRKSDDMKIIGGKHIAEDISKIRKASFAISLGKGD